VSYKKESLVSHFDKSGLKSVSLTLTVSSKKEEVRRSAENVRNAENELKR
jgi:hypothetical protein